MWNHSEDSFYNEIVLKDKYEWGNIAKNELIQKKYGKIIYIRDIRMHFYVEGISKSINSIDGIISLVAELTKGYEVTVVGTSSGGYMSCILGCSLRAKKVISFGGQFNLTKWGGGMNKLLFDDFPYLVKHLNDTKYSIWYDLYCLLHDSNCNIFHFYSGLCKADIIQADLVFDLESIHLIAMRDVKHGTPVLGFSIPYLIVADEKKLIDISKKKIVGKLYLAYKFAGICGIVKWSIKRFVKRFRQMCLPVNRE